MEHNKKPIMIIGGLGKTGSRIAKKLTELGWPVNIASRSTSPRFDWEDDTTWKAAIQGYGAVYIAYQPDLAMPGAIDAISKIVHIAKTSKVNKLVLLSGRGEQTAMEAEEIVRQSGITYTIVRASWFNQNFSEGSFLDAVLAGVVELPITNVVEPFVDADDIADVAVAALTDNAHDGKLYELTGTRLLTFKQAIDEIAVATGRDIRYCEISMDAYAAALKNYEVPTDIIQLICYLFTEVLDGRNASIAHGVKEALGRQPIDFSDFAKKAAANGTWG